MLKDSDSGETTVAPATASANDVAASLPIEPMGRLLRQLESFPWVAFGAIGTGIGVALLYLYFGSIDFVPADVPAILSASLLTAMLALVFYVWVVASLVAPVWAYRSSTLPPPMDGLARRSSAVALPALQFLGVGLLLLFVGLRLSFRCSTLGSIFLIVDAVFALPGGLGWAWSESMREGHWSSWVKRLPSAAGVSFVSALPVSVLLVFLVPDQDVSWWHLGLVVALWLVVVLGSIFLDKMPVWGCALIVTAMSPIITLLIPAMLGYPFLFPSKVAEMAGIREQHAMELRVPRSTCDLIQSAIGASKVAKPVTCGISEWATVHAQVLSNLGDRWLIDLPLAGARPQGQNGSLRVSIPGDGVQTVRQIPAFRAIDGAAACRT